MAQPSNQDILQGFDPTGYTQISGAQLLQMMTGLSPYADKGFILETTDVGGIPEVPDALTTTKWKQYLWRRISAAGVTLYVWSDNQPTHIDPVSSVSLLQWYTATDSSIAPGSITGSLIAPSTITPANISSVAYSQVTGAPSALPPNGVAGGSLSGSYPDPVVAAGAIDLSTMTNVTGYAAKQNIRVNDSATGLIAETKKLLLLAEPINPTNDSQLVAVKSDASGFEYVNQHILQQIVTVDSTATTLGSGTAFNENVACANTVGVAISTLVGSITTTRADSTILVEAEVWLAFATTTPLPFLGALSMYLNGASPAIATGLSGSPSGGSVVESYPTKCRIVYKFNPGVAGQNQQFTFMVSSTTNTIVMYYNSTSAGKSFGGTLMSSVKMTEYIN